MKKLLSVLVLSLVLTTTVMAKSEKVVICHATESETNPWVEIEVSINAINGHFDNNGTPLAGHEDDLLLAQGEHCPGVSEPTETPEPSVTPAPSLTPEPDPSPELPDTSM